MTKEARYRVYLINGKEFDVNPDDGEAIVVGLDNPEILAFSVRIRESKDGHVLRKFPREAIEAIEYPEDEMDKD